MTLAALVVSLLLGLALGYRFSGLRRAASVGQRAGVYLLVFAMGMGVGLDESIVSQLGELGVQAVVLALCVTLGSAACTFALARLAWKRL